MLVYIYISLCHMGSGYALGQRFMSIFNMLLCYSTLWLNSLLSTSVSFVCNHRNFFVIFELSTLSRLSFNLGAMVFICSILNYFYLGYSYTITAISFPISYVVQYGFLRTLCGLNMFLIDLFMCV